MPLHESIADVVESDDFEARYKEYANRVGSAWCRLKDRKARAERERFLLDRAPYSTRDLGSFVYAKGCRLPIGCEQRSYAMFLLDGVAHG